MWTVRGLLAHRGIWIPMIYIHVLNRSDRSRRNGWGLGSDAGIAD
jgi:hypothetical protein